jgi:oxygen-independent coproporphyrinogen-3 oxidase
VHTVFIGGGTPSLLSAAGMDRLLSDIRALLPLDADAEITMEANPGTFEAERFASYRASGINRLSIGIQSFNDAQALGRIHGEREARAAIDIALKHFDNVNLDLMYALPGRPWTNARATWTQRCRTAPRTCRSIT